MKEELWGRLYYCLFFMVGNYYWSHLSMTYAVNIWMRQLYRCEIRASDNHCPPNQCYCRQLIGEEFRLRHRNSVVYLTE